MRYTFIEIIEKRIIRLLQLDVTLSLDSQSYRNVW